MWGIKVFGRVSLDVTIEHEEFVEAANSADCARNRSWSQTIACETRYPLPQIGALQLNHRFFVGGGPTVKTCEIACVTLERMSRKTFFNLNV